MNYTRRRSLGEGGGMEGNERDRQDGSPLLSGCRACCVSGKRAAVDPAGGDERRELSARSQSAPPCPSLHTLYREGHSSLHVQNSLGASARLIHPLQPGLLVVLPPSHIL